MKIIVFLTILFFANQSFSLDYTVKVVGRDKPLKCSSEASIDGLFCKSGEEYLIVKSFGDSFPASGVLEGDKKMVSYEISSIINDSDDSIVYESSTPMFSFSGGWEDNRPRTLGADYNEVAVELMTITPPENAVKPSKEYSEFLKAKTSSLEAIKNKILKEYDAGIYRAVLNDGSELSCKRQENKEKGSIELKYEEMFGEKVNCGLFDCGKDKNGNRQILLSHYSPQQPYSEVLRLSPEGVIDGPKLKNLYSENGSTPIAANTEVTDQMLSAWRGKSEFIEKDFVPDNLKDQSEFFKNSSYPNYDLYVADTTRLCNSDLVDKMNKAIEEHKNKKLNSELVQYISASNDALIGYYLPPSSVPEYACKNEGVYYHPDYEDDAKEIDSDAIAPITLEKAKELFSKAQAMDDIAWNYKLDGCYARAHLMARRFEDMGVEVNKIWMKGELAVETEGEDTIEWNFHVAPVVSVKGDDGNQKQYVIDPSIFGGPVPVEEWVGRITKPSFKVEETEYPFPNNSAMYKRNSYAFSNSTPYLPNDLVGMSEEYKMNLADSTMKKYKEY